MTGTEVLIDGLERSGSLIIGPSFVERRLRVKTKSSVSAHNLEVYRAGLVAIIDDAMYNKRASEKGRARMMSDVSLSSTALTAPAPLQHVDEEEEEVGHGADLLPTVTKTLTRERERTASASVSDGYEDGGVTHYLDRHTAATGASGASGTYLYSSLIDLSGDDLAEHMPTSHSSHLSSPSATYSPIITDTSGDDKTVSS